MSTRQRRGNNDEKGALETRRAGALRRPSAALKSHSVTVRPLLLTATLFLSAACAVGTAPAGSDEGAGPRDVDDAGGPQADTITAKASATREADSIDAGATDAKAKGAPTAAPDASPASPASPSQAACPGYALPNQTAPCHACQSTSATCQPNGCFGGYYCDLSGPKCHPKPSGC